MPACYTNRLSLYPGETFTLHASARGGSLCTVQIARIGRSRELVLTMRDVAVGDHPTPPNADRDGCHWPVALTLKVGDWRSGYYDITLADDTGEATHHFICVKRARAHRNSEHRKAKAGMVLATNTYHAYNWWGGANAYAHVTKRRSALGPARL